MVRLEVKNDSGKDVTVFPEVDSFFIDQKTGRPVFSDSDEAVGWIRATPASVTIRRGELGFLAFTISVPESALPMGHYIGLFAAERPRQGQVAVGSRVGSLLFLLVGGDAREHVLPEYFSPEHVVVWKEPARFFLQLKNTGTVHVSPSGILNISRMIGENPQGAYRAKIGNRAILPNERWESVHDVPLSWKDTGRNTATAYLSYGETNQRLRVDTVFWYVPWQGIVFLGVIFLLCIGIIFLRIKKQREIKELKN